MKKLLIGLLALSSIHSFATVSEITHPTCKLWVPTWEPQGRVYVDESELLVRKLRHKGYDARFGMARSEDSDTELFLGVKEDVLRESNILRKGKANLTLIIKDLNLNETIKQVFTDSKSVTCAFFHLEDPGAYKDYTKACTSKILKRIETLPDCIKD